MYLLQGSSMRSIVLGSIKKIKMSEAITNTQVAHNFTGEKKER